MRNLILLITAVSLLLCLLSCESNPKAGESGTAAPLGSVTVAEGMGAFPSESEKQTEEQTQGQTEDGTQAQTSSGVSWSPFV